MFTLTRLTPIAVILVSWLALPVHSMEIDNKATTTACGEDVKKFCYDVTPGEGRIGLCLEEYRKELSSQCQQFITQTSQQVVQEFLAACQHDVTQYCSQVQPGGGRVMQCLRENSSKISSDCAAVIKQR